MIKAESQLLTRITQKKNILFFICITLLAFATRYVGRGFISIDMDAFLIPWFETIQSKGGLSSLSEQVGDYNILYQTLIALMSYIKLNCVYQYKLLSILFDYVLAIAVAWYLRKFTARSWAFFNGVYATVLLLPTVVLNSAFWGQCDSIYTAFLIFFLGELYQEKYTRSFVFLGLAFACKLQAIFILPFAVAYYFYKKKFSIGKFIISLFTFWASGIVAFAYGRNLLEPFRIYVGQSNIYENMWLDIASFWQLLGDNYAALSKFAILETLGLCGVGLYIVLSGYIHLESAEAFFSSACWFVWTCILFLPAMHERYTYFLDILLLILTFLSVKYLKYALISCAVSLITYGSFLFGTSGLEKWQVVLYIAAFVHFTFTIVAKPVGEVIKMNKNVV